MAGKVDAIFTDADGTKYRVQYADSTGRLADTYCRENELAAL